jgi:hypothetical protein
MSASQSTAVVAVTIGEGAETELEGVAEGDGDVEGDGMVGTAGAGRTVDVVATGVASGTGAFALRIADATTIPAIITTRAARRTKIGLATDGFATTPPAESTPGRRLFPSASRRPSPYSLSGVAFPPRISTPDYRPSPCESPAGTSGHTCR